MFQKYHCLCDCPNVLETINHVNNIKMAGIARSKYTYFDLPWNRNSMIQLFTNETKLVQLMRFYYALSSFLCLEIDKKSVQEKARLVLLNGNIFKNTTIAYVIQTIKSFKLFFLVHRHIKYMIYIFFGYVFAI